MHAAYHRPAASAATCRPGTGVGASEAIKRAELEGSLLDFTFRPRCPTTSNGF